MNANNQNSINNLSNNTNLNNLNNTSVVRSILMQLVLHDKFVFAVVDGEMCVVESHCHDTMFHVRDGVTVDLLSVDDVVENCDVLVRGRDVQEYVHDSGAEYALEVTVTRDEDARIMFDMNYARRDSEQCGGVWSKFGPDIFDLVLPYRVVNKLVDRYSYELNSLRVCNSTSAHHEFECGGLAFTVVGISKDADSVCWFSIRCGTSEERYLVKAKKVLMEDKFGNRLDEDGEIIVEDAE